MFKFRLPLSVLVGMALSVLVTLPAYAFQDPTQPVGGVAVQHKREQLKLESVLLSGERKVAVINGKAYQQGERVNGAVLKSINQRSVVLQKGNQQQKLTLFKKIVNK